MSPSVNSDPNTDTRIALLEKDIVVVGDQYRKVESAIEKMSEATVVIQRMVTMHEMRLEDREKADAQLFDSIERRKDEQVRIARDNAERLEKLSLDLRTTIREEVGVLKNNIDEKLANIEDSFKDTSDEIKELKDRVHTLERWRWLIVGGAGVLGFIVAKMPALMTLFTTGALPAAGAG